MIPDPGSVACCSQSQSWRGRWWCLEKWFIPEPAAWEDGGFSSQSSSPSLSAGRGEQRDQGGGWEVLMQTSTVHFHMDPETGQAVVWCAPSWFMVAGQQTSWSWGVRRSGLYLLKLVSKILIQTCCLSESSVSVRVSTYRNSVRRTVGWVTKTGRVSVISVWFQLRITHLPWGESRVQGTQCLPRREGSTRSTPSSLELKGHGRCRECRYLRARFMWSKLPQRFAIIGMVINKCVVNGWNANINKGQIETISKRLYCWFVLLLWKLTPKKMWV